jgi:hypothetical protein
MLKEYHTHSELNPVLWENGELRPGLQQGFMKIAQKFYDFLEIDTPILDVILIGSNANYNWTKYSDIDLHVVINYMEVGDNLHMTKNYFHLKKAIWNHNFPLKYKGIDIELYAQDMNENLHASVGVYSVAHGKWINRPKADLISIDDTIIQQKAAPFEFEIENLKQDHPNLEKRVHEILMRLRKLRQTGLEAEGEYSVENLAFKHLRNKGLISRLKELLHINTMSHLQVENALPVANKRHIDENILETLAQHIAGHSIMDDSGWQSIMSGFGGVEDAMGQWKHPGKCTMIPSNNITMKNVGYPVVGIDDTGYMQMMQPEQQYSYPGGKVFEIPVNTHKSTLLSLLQKVKNYAK